MSLEILKSCISLNLEGDRLLSVGLLSGLNRQINFHLTRDIVDDDTDVGQQITNDNDVDFSTMQPKFKWEINPSRTR